MEYQQHIKTSIMKFLKIEQLDYINPKINLTTKNYPIKSGNNKIYYRSSIILIPIPKMHNFSAPTFIQILSINTPPPTTPHHHHPL